MRYFDYQQSGTLGRVWSLFSSLGSLSEDKRLNSTEYSHTVEIVNAALRGYLATSDESIENFNLEAYEYKCSENDRIAKIYSADKILYIVDNVEENSVKMGEIHENNISLSKQGDFDLTDSSISFESDFQRLLKLRSLYIKVHGVDLVFVLKASLKGIPEAIGEIKILSSYSKELKELIKSLCDNNDSGMLLKRLEELDYM